MAVPRLRQPALQLSNPFAALEMPTDVQTPNAQLTPDPAAVPPAMGIPQGIAPLIGSFQQQGWMSGRQPPQQQSPQPPQVEVPAAVVAACQGNRPVQVLLQQADASLLSKAERKSMLSYMREQLLDGYAEALRDLQQDLDKARKHLRELYDRQDLEVIDGWAYALWQHTVLSPQTHSSLKIWSAAQVTAICVCSG